MCRVGDNASLPVADDQSWDIAQIEQKFFTRKSTHLFFNFVTNSMHHIP